MRRPRLTLLLAAGLVALAATASAAYASFPYGTPSPGKQDYHLSDGEFPDDLSGNVEWMYSATAGSDNAAYGALQGARELNGIRGAHIVDKSAAPDVAWEKTTGRPDVTISVLDSGIKWDDRGVMVDVRRKIRLNKGELPLPRNDRSTSLEDGGSCAGYDPTKYDANGDGVFNVIDYACDSRVEKSKAARTARGQPAGQGPDDLLDPQDVLIAFTDGTDADHNGFTDDIVGWDFLDNDNDPYDDVQYGHGSGEIRDSTAEANNSSENGGALGACPNCMSIPLRVGDSFVADVNRFAQATVYATDNGVSVVQEALGTLNNSTLATQAVDYAYNHGVTVIASAADEAAQHNNWPSSNPHVILVNSVTQYATQDPIPTPLGAPSYLSFNGCTNFNSKITLAIPSVSCSSDATGRGSGMAGLVYSAALNARDAGHLNPHPDCRRTNGDPCVVSANEVRQLMASGTVDSAPTSDDVDFAQGAELACPAPGCTDPFAGAPGSASRPPGIADGVSYPARKGHDQFYGYGRANMEKATSWADGGVIPPEAEIESPDWYSMIDPAKGSLQIRGQVFARGHDYTCQVLVAPGSYPNNGSTPTGDFKPVGGPSHCDGSTAHTDHFNGVLATVDLNDLQGRYPPGTGFHGPLPKPTPATHNGRPNQDPNGFVVKVIVTSNQSGRKLTGEDRRNLRLHRDSELMPGFPRDLGGDGASSPTFADLDGDNRKELVIAGSDGFVHAYRPDGSELPGWPVRGDQPALHTGGRGFASGEVSANFGGAILGSVAVGDLNGDGSPEVVADDLEGKVYGWDAAGHRVFSQEADPHFSGKPLHPFERVRQGRRFRTQHGFIASPVLADVDRNDGGKLEIVAAGMDRHVYVWNDDGSRVPGFPVLLVDRSKISGVDATTHAPTFKSGIGDDRDQGAIVDTPAVGNITGDARPEIVVGTNEEYPADDDGGLNSSIVPNGFVLNIAGTALGPGNSRLYAIKPDGDRDGDPKTDDFEISGHWPVKVGLLETQVLPVVGEGITGSPIIGPANCGGNTDPKIGVSPDAGPAYLFNVDGTSCLSGGGGGADTPVQASGGSGVAAVDTQAVVPAFGHPAFGKIDPGSDELSFLTPAIGLNRALDIALPEYQEGQDFLGVWSPSQNGQFHTGFPGTMDDLQFLTGPSVADLDGKPGEEVVSASASLDLEGFNGAGLPIDSQHWPKLTSDWVVANPLIGTWGTDDTDSGARKTLFEITRSGFMLAYTTGAPPCSAASWPRFHHDDANSGDFRRDAEPPGKPMDAKLSGSTLSFRAPGDDGLCGKADHYEVVASDGQISARNFRAQQDVSGAPKPDDPGKAQSMRVPAGARSVGIRAVDEAGNRGRLAVVDRGAGTGGCLNSRGGAHGKRLGPARLGRTRRAQRRAFRGKRLRSRGGIDRYCAAGGGTFRIGYPTRRLNRGLGRSLRARIRNRAVLILTSSKHFSVKGIKRGTSVRRLHRRLRGEWRVRVGHNAWYLARSGGVRLLFKVRGKRVLEVGIGDRRLSTSRRAARHYLRAWQL
jgi:hypothetical protein